MDSTIGKRRPRFRYVAGTLAAGALIGGVAATAFDASAASGTNSSSATSPSSGSGTGTGATNTPGQRPANDHSSTPVRSDEKAVSTQVAATLKVAALKAVPGGTVYRVETDADGATYEAHMTKSDGTKVTVKMDANFAVTSTVNGMG